MRRPFTEKSGTQPFQTASRTAVYYRGLQSRKMSHQHSIQPKSPHRELHWFVLAFLLICLLSCGGGNQSSVSPPQQEPPPTPTQAGAISYVDCSASTNGAGTQSSPWNTLASVNALTFNPGDQILFNRGTTCREIVGWPSRADALTRFPLSRFPSKRDGKAP
jgi:hypothetical protein